MSQPLSLRLPDAVRSRLTHRARLSKIPPRTLAQRYIEEGLRTDEHPMIRFVTDGTRRVKMVGSRLDVWQVIALVKDSNGDLDEAAAYLDRPRAFVEAALAYYGAFAQEINQEIEDNKRAADEAYEAYEAGQAAISS